MKVKQLQELLATVDPLEPLTVHIHTGWLNHPDLPWMLEKLGYNIVQGKEPERVKGQVG